ncbi:MAG: sulfite exporter TauE/SafE family protein [Acidimicrobiia bacterium]
MDVPFSVELLLLASTGAIAGALNVIGAGGSFLTLPVLLFVGLPASIANGTNRVGVLAQNIGGLYGFHRHGAVDWKWSLTACLPALAGAALGVWLALALPNVAFKRFLSIAMLALTLWSLLSPGAGGQAKRAPKSPWHPGVVLGFFVVGVYGGFIQAGVGFIVLSVTTWAGLDMLRGNAAKLLTVLLVTVLSLAVFAASAQVDWPRGLALATGNLIGSHYGVKLAIYKGDAWLQRAVTTTVVLFAVALWFQ